MSLSRVLNSSATLWLKLSSNLKLTLPSRDKAYLDNLGAVGDCRQDISRRPLGPSLDR
jgi:hypothetical protein